MDEKEVDNSSAPHKRSKSVPSMSPVNFNSTQLQDQPIVGRSRSNTVDSAERLLVRTQRRGARLSSGGLLRNQSKKRRNKNGLEKSRSIDVVDRDDESSRNSSNSSESSEVHEQEEQTIIRARKQGFCLPAVDSVVETLKTMDDEQEFPNNIDPDQTNFPIVFSANKKSLLVDQHLTSTTTLHDYNETSKISEDKKPNDNLRTSERTDNRRQPEEIAQGQMLNLRKDWNTNTRRRSLPADLSDYQIDSNLGDYNEGHEYHTTRLTNDSQTDMKFQNNYRIVYTKRCQNNWRRWHSLPEVNENESDSTDLVSNTLDRQETWVLKEPVDQESSNVQDPSQSHEHGNTILNFSSENLKDEATMAAEITVIHEQQQSLNSEENSNIKKSDTNKKSNKISRSYSLPTRLIDVVGSDERQGKNIEELKRTKSLTADEFDEVFPLMLSEQSTSKLEPDNAKFNDDRKEGCNLDEKSFVHEKPKRKRRRRAKSLPVTLVLEEIPEESPEDYNCDQYESVEDMAKKHVNRAFQDLLRKIQANRQRPREIKVKRSRSLSTIKEIVVSSEALHELEQSRDENVAAQEKTRKEHETEQGTTDHEQEHVHENTHHEDDDQHEQYGEREKIHEIYDEGNEQVFEDPQEQENNINKEDDLQQLEKQADLLMNKDVQASQKSLKEQLKLQLGESAEHETLAVLQETQENNGEQEQLDNGYDLHDNAAQEDTVMNESLTEQVSEEKSSLQKAKEELHIDIPQILISDVGLEQCQSINVDTYVRDVHDDIDGSEEQEGSVEYSKTIAQTEELKSPDDEDIQGTILEHINNMEFCEFEHSISQRSIVNVVSCMERIPEDPDKETALESTETESKLIETVEESIQDEFDLAETELDSTDGKEEQSTLKRTGSMRRVKSPRGESSGPSNKKSWPLTNDTSSEQSNREQKHVTWSDVTHGPSESESDQEDQEDGYQDQYEPGPRGNISFAGFNDSYTSSNQLDITQDEYEEGPIGEICFIAGSADEHASPDNESDLDEAISYHPHSDELQTDPIESQFDVLVRNAISSYLEPDYSQSESPIHKAVATGSVGHLKELIEDGADVNALDEHGWPPLHVATLFNKVDCAALLLEAGADLQGYTDSLIHEYQTLRERGC